MKYVIALALSVVVVSCNAKSDLEKTVNGSAELSGQVYKILEVNGAANLKDVTVEKYLELNGKSCVRECNLKKVKSNGNLEFVKSKVSEDLDVNGDCEINESEFRGACDMNGDVQLKKSTLHGDCTVCGSFQAHDTNFWNSLTVCSKKMKLVACTTKDIYVLKTNSGVNVWKSFLKWFGWEDKQKQEIKLVDTEVQGNIDFEGQNGTVILIGKSSITGKVIGGNVEERE